MPGVKDWIKKSSSDLKASQKLLDDEETLDCAVFHAHQCAEKIFKAFLVLTKQPIPKTHNLGFLLSSCADSDPTTFMLLKEEAKNLNPYCHESRYPNDNFYVDNQIAQQAVTMAERVFCIVKKTL